MKNKKEIDMIVGVLKKYYITKRNSGWAVGFCRKNIATSILIKLKENEAVIFKARLTKGINLSKVIEQVLYPKYIGKKIIILEEE